MGFSGQEYLLRPLLAQNDRDVALETDEEYTRDRTQKQEGRFKEDC